MLFFFCAGLPAQDKCNVEVKVLLPPAETQNAVVALKAKKETPSRVYFFDTDALDLLSQGVIVRLRRDAHSELTIKLRSPTGRKLGPTTEGGDDFKCEIDQTEEGAVFSYSIRKRYVAEELPQTGNEVFLLLSAGQKKLLRDAQASVDWTRVQRIVEVKSSAWQAQSQPRLGKLALELWEWQRGKLLELSTKVSSEAASSTYAELRQLIETKRLSMSPTQRPKTTIVLQSVAHIAPR
ncbi:MAG TPA: CYTH domain-containing protein [Candidatus Acidoferrum sp.]|nr:CYTH domain-containing protein [Candidatus Acidoferrum sp.]